MIAYAQLEDVDRLKKIWQEVFGDEEELIDLFFEKVFECENTLVWRTDEAVAMLYMLPYNKGRDYYLYALATMPEYRNQGIMTELIRQAIFIMKKREARSVFLIPDNDELEKYYAAFGFDKELDIYEYGLNEGTEYRVTKTDEFLREIPPWKKTGITEYVVYEEMMENGTFTARLADKGIAIVSDNTIRRCENMDTSALEKKVWNKALVCTEFPDIPQVDEMYIPF